jgi:hypothetical protein
MHLAKKEKESKELMLIQGQSPKGTELFPRDAAVPTIEKQPKEKRVSARRINFLAAFPIGVILQKENI